MLTRIFIAPRDPDLIVDQINTVWSSYEGIENPCLDVDQISGLQFYQSKGHRLLRIPFVLKDVEIEKVELSQRSQITLSNARDQGRYESMDAFGYVEHSVPPNQNPTLGNIQYITVEGKTLSAANNLMDAIIGGTIKPVKVMVAPPICGFQKWVMTTFRLKRMSWGGRS